MMHDTRASYFGHPGRLRAGQRHDWGEVGETPQVMFIQYSARTISPRTFAMNMRAWVLIVLG